MAAIKYDSISHDDQPASPYSSTSTTATTASTGSRSVSKTSTSTSAASSRSTATLRSRSVTKEKRKTSKEKVSPKTQTNNLKADDIVDLIDNEERREVRRRNSHTMRNWASFKALGNGRTMIEEALGLDVHDDRNVSPPGSPPFSDRMEDRGKKQKRVMARRGLERRNTELYEKMDNLAETVYRSNFEVPWFLTSCMDQPLYQQVVQPAEYATRSRRAAHCSTTDLRLRQETADRLEKQFGLPAFETSGYVLLDPEECSMPDKRVYTRLGLQPAMHRNTSIERLCLVASKGKIPERVTTEQVLNFVRQIVKCDHVNVLHCKEVFEDQHHLYFCHESFPCVTLLSVLDAHTWTQEQIVNIIRECSAAMSYCHASNVTHLGWTLCHVLLPATCLHGDPMVSKVFGFGHFGLIMDQCPDRMCWAPEALAEWGRIGITFPQKMELHVKVSCDYWSLGVIAYTLVSRRPPILAKPETMDEMIQAHCWSLNLSFDSVDIEAKALVEGLMHRTPEKRTTAEAVIHNEWIRRRYRAPQHTFEVLEKLEQFCSAPLAKRLFGRFLVDFLDAEQMRQIAISFYALDVQGDGIISFQDLKACFKSFERPGDHPADTAKMICEWLCRSDENISISQFAECMAEELLDGRALRHAFEQLDDNGSEEVSVEELFQALHSMDETITIEQVLQYVDEAEMMANGQMRKARPSKAPDHKIDYEEFTLLFPKRLGRMRKLQERAQEMDSSAVSFQNQFLTVEGQCRKWIAQVESERAELIRTSHETPDEQSVNQFMKDLKKIGDLLKVPPGPLDAKRMAKMYEDTLKGSPRRNKHAHKASDLLGFDSFLQDHASKNYWNVLLLEEVRLLKAGTSSSGKAPAENRKHELAIEGRLIRDLCERAVEKIDDVLSFAKAQCSEYQSLLQVLNDRETPMPTLVMSCRGLPGHEGDSNCNMASAKNDNGSDANVIAKLLSKMGCFSCQTGMQ